MDRRRNRIPAVAGGIWILGCGIVLLSAAVSLAAEAAAPATQCPGTAEVSGGLCVQVGCDDLGLAVELARTGRFLVQVLDGDAARVEKARQEVPSQNLYGLVSVDRLGAPNKLPYAENLVNLLVLADPSAVPPGEMARVLRPGAIVLLPQKPDAEASLRAAGLEEVQVVEAGRTWVKGRKPWPAEMDQWTHSRHAADGNPVSHDALVGPPRRIRWVAGPAREDSRLVTAAGRNFYAGLLARDAFNGLPIWRRPLAMTAQAVPVAAGDRLFAVADKRVLVLDGVTGETIRELTEAGTPGDLLALDDLLVTVDGQTVRAVEPETGRLRWKHAATEPQCVIAGDGAVFLLQGSARRGETVAAVCLDLSSGQVRWQRSEYPWAPKVRRAVYHRGLVAYEVSTLKDEKAGNVIHMVSASDGRLLWSREFVPGMQHMKQARAMFVGDLLWVLEHRRCVALDPTTGLVKRDAPAGFCHCFPPVATERYMLAGEMELTDLASGKLDANRITKAACSRDFGWVPANGLIYVCPKHCVCWPMLRGYAALAPAANGSGPLKKKPEPADFVLETGVEVSASAEPPAADEWPCYRQNAWRSASTTAEVAIPQKQLWAANLGGWPDGPIASDWRENPFIRGPVTPPVVAAGAVYVARPDAHELVALDAQNGAVRWRYTANGRIDTAPTIHRGLCLFGTKNGWVYCLRAESGELVWRLRAAPSDERIVAYGQVESPWPVPGSVLVVDDVAYFAAGRQPLADGGILVFAAEPATGKIRWVERLDSLPMNDFYSCVGLEFDNFDLLQREDDGVALSRWWFRAGDGKMTCKARDPFVLAKTGSSGVIAPRGCWTYAPRHQPRHGKDGPVRGPVVFRDGTLLGCLDDCRTLYRRDFTAGDCETFDRSWMTGWAAGENSRKGTGEFWLSQRLAQKAAWTLPLFPDSEPKQQVAAMILARDRLFIAGSQGGLAVLSANDGQRLAHVPLAPAVWDGLAAAGGRLFVSTQAGEVVCLGAP